MPPQFNPDVVAATRGHDREAIAGGGRPIVEFVLDGAHLAQRAQGISGQQLRQHAFHRAQAEALARQLDRTGGGDHIGLFAHVEHQRVAVAAHDRGQERIYERHHMSGRTGLREAALFVVPPHRLGSRMTCFGPWRQQR